MAVVGEFKAGRSGRLVVHAAGNIAGASANLTLNSYEIRETGSREDTTNFECVDTGAAAGIGGGGGMLYTQGLISSKKCSFTLSGDWDAAKDPLGLGTVLGIYPRDDGPGLRIKLDRANGVEFLLPYTLILEATVTSSVADGRGKVSVRFTGESQGNYTYDAGE